MLLQIVVYDPVEDGLALGFGFGLLVAQKCKQVRSVGYGVKHFRFDQPTQLALHTQWPAERAGRSRR